jgi:hypothetical protein
MIDDPNEIPGKRRFPRSPASLKLVILVYGAATFAVMAKQWMPNGIPKVT